ncbi:MAG: glutamate-1-semialdehyde-2,1-aminomutase [Omnitrophica bacterium GWA2_52_8]|nr:MAG: glutamate-1-semialdehyde-2,1-aminomutase [Omnitrophica bacterium GWA2_52_8]
MTLFAEAQKYIPSGVNSPVRAFKAVGGEPVFIKRGKGPYIWDEKGRRYLDFCASWGPLLFGHAPDGLLRTLTRELKNGTSFGAATSKEIKLAKKICSLVPSVEKVRLVSSGTEAVMSAVRLARGFTGKKKILKIDGGYHGHVDSLLIKAGSGGATFGIPDSAGIPEELAKLTLSIPFNDAAALEQIFEREGWDIAAFILEPVPANMGVIPPLPGYLEKARTLTKQHNALLIFDEVITGFRLAPGGAQQYFGVTPDLTCLGKILGGGLPLAAFGGRKGIMDVLAPNGPVYQAGTLSGNPLAVAAALWMLDEVEKAAQPVKGLTGYDKLNLNAEIFYAALEKVVRKKGAHITLNRIQSMFTLFFSGNPVVDYASAKTSVTKHFARFFNDCLKHGLYIAPSQFEANFVSTVHSSSELAAAAAKMSKSF